MAYSVSLKGIPRDHQAPIWKEEPRWWDARALMEDARFRKVESPGYVDYIASLRPQEALELLHRFKLSYETQVSPCADVAGSEYARIEQRLQAGAPETCWVLVEVFEWESGM